MSNTDKYTGPSDDGQPHEIPDGYFFHPDTPGYRERCNDLAEVARKCARK